MTVGVCTTPVPVSPSMVAKHVAAAFQYSLRLVRYKASPHSERIWKHSPVKASSSSRRSRSIDPSPLTYCTRIRVSSMAWASKASLKYMVAGYGGTDMQARAKCSKD